jgi:UDP-2,3-diacylglucosamine hydrolase
MKTIILSDAHLSVAPEGRKIMNLVVAFLRELEPKEIRRIIVLGDLFDFWFEYKHVIFSGYFDVLRAFADLHDAGVELWFICGNHDFWTGRFLEEHLGFAVYPDPFTVELDGRRVHLAHGDGLNPKDWRYRIYKRIARWPLVVWAFRLLHPDWAMAIAQGVSRRSRSMFSPADPRQRSEIGPLRSYAENMLASGEADVVLCGHSHYPIREEFPTPEGTGLYINTGDWLWHQSYVVSENGAYRLESFHGGVLPEQVPD